MYVHRKRVILLFRVLCLVISLIIRCKIKNKFISSNNNFIFRAALPYYILLSTQFWLAHLCRTLSFVNCFLRCIFVLFCTAYCADVTSTYTVLVGSQKDYLPIFFLAHFPYVDLLGFDKLVYLSGNNEWSNEVQRK